MRKMILVGLFLILTLGAIPGRANADRTCTFVNEPPRGYWSCVDDSGGDGPRG